MSPEHDPFYRRRLRGRLSRLKLQLLALLGVAVVAVLVWLVYFSSVLGVQQVDVEGTRLLDDAEVEAAAAVEPGAALARLDLDAIGARVEELDPVASVAVERRWPTGLAITVTERRAVAVVRQGGTLSGMDPEGVLFRDYHRLPRSLPLVDAGALAPTGREEVLAEVATALAALETDVVRIVDHVEVSSRDSIVLVLDEGARVTWGSAEDSDVKAEVLTVLLEVEASAYDVSVPGQPTTRE